MPGYGGTTYLLYTYGADERYDNALTALRAFHQCAQRFGEPIVQYVAALCELLLNCEFGLLADDMLRDKILEKTCSLCIRERLLLETDLSLQKAITIAGEIESAVAEA